ncbi:MAG: hypothetical protein NUV50_00385 [Rhodospirillales bacterium]|nr:hypothetical protein [Rhodospirillales bacterium]
MIIQSSNQENIERRLSRREACEYLKHTWGINRKPSTLAAYATNGGGPIFEKDGRFPKYTIQNLDKYARETLGEPVTSNCELRAQRNAAA